MCGIIGMIHYADNGFDFDSRNALLPMLLLNSLRGPHSTGLLGIQEGKKAVDRKVEWAKRVGPPHGILSEPDGKKFLDRMFNSYHAVIGHGRYATQGKIIADNAHPFIHDNISLVHNGSVRNLYSLRVKGEEMRTKFEVDSEAIAYMFAREGVEDTLKEIDGAFALMWHDAKTGCIHAIRNSERPLFVVKRQNKGGLFFSSETPTLKYIAEKFSGIVFDGDILTLQPERLYTFPLAHNMDKQLWHSKEVKMGHWGRGNWNYMGRGSSIYNSNKGNEAGSDFGVYGDMNDLFPEATPPMPAKTAPIIPFKPRNDEGTLSAAMVREAAKKAAAVRNQESGMPKVSEIVKYGIRFRVGQLIAFFPTSFEPIGKKNDLYTYIHGHHVVNDAVAVACHYKEDARIIKDEVVLAGTITNIHYLNENKSKSVLRIYVKDLIRLSEHIQNLILNKEVFVLEDEMKKHPHIEIERPESVQVSLKNDKKMSFAQFEKMIGWNCARCGGAIELFEAPRCLVVEDISNATQKEKAHGGIVCPDCITHTVIN